MTDEQTKTPEKKSGKRKPVVMKRNAPMAPQPGKQPEELFVVNKPVVRGRNTTRQEPAYKIPWHKGVDHPEAGKIIEDRFYALGIYTVDDLKNQKAAASRIVAEAFKGEVSSLIQFGLSTSHLPKAEEFAPEFAPSQE